MGRRAARGWLQLCLAMVVWLGSGGHAEQSSGVAQGEALPEGVWRLVAIERAPGERTAVPPAPSYTLQFTGEGAVVGDAHCNRYTGLYVHPAAGRLAISSIATTRMACQTPSMAGEFLRALGSARGYEQRGDELRIVYEPGDVLIFVREPSSAGSDLEVGRTFVFECGEDLDFMVRTRPGDVVLLMPGPLGGESYVLERTPAATGALYQRGGVVFWSQGDRATIQVNGQTYSDCLSRPGEAAWQEAGQTGARFRAEGREPAWSVDVYEDRIVLTTDAGGQRTDVPLVESTVEGTRVTFYGEGDGHRLTVQADRRPCLDTVTGDELEVVTTVTLDGRTYHGCGRYL